LPRAGPGGQDEEVGDRGEAGQVENDDVVGVRVGDQPGGVDRELARRFEALGLVEDRSFSDDDSPPSS
jgi:hypothetical protein